MALKILHLGSIVLTNAMCNRQRASMFSNIKAIISILFTRVGPNDPKAYEIYSRYLHTRLVGNGGLGIPDYLVSRE
jgi:hypothetical protein